MRKSQLYENFVLRHPDSNFFQSSAFGEFQESLPYRGKSWSLQILKSGNGDRQIDVNSGASSSCLVVKIKLPLNFCWLWVPYGPLGQSENIFKDLARIAKEERVIFARIEPPLHSTFHLRLSGAGILHSKTAPARSRYTPEHTLILDLDKTEDEILAQMKPKGRYNIQVAKKHGVVVERIAGADVNGNILNNFYEILQKPGLATNSEFIRNIFIKIYWKFSGAIKWLICFWQKRRTKNHRRNYCCLL